MADIDFMSLEHASEDMVSNSLTHGQAVTISVSGIEPTVGTTLSSPAMQAIYKKIKLVANTRSTVLISGETGTGKNVIARLVHNQSNRRNGPFVVVHCGSLPENLVESELFGHEKGSFTGAYRRKRGKFELAAGGTIFLDEIATIPPSVQIRLLQVLQERVIHRVGGEEDVPVDVRIIAAGNEDLSALVESNKFRSDLFYRLNVFPIEIPPLRDHIEDISLLAEHMLNRLVAQHGKNITSFVPCVLESFKSYQWPGNVRELENVIERAFILETSHVLSPESFPIEIMESAPTQTSFSLDVSIPLADVRKIVLENTERAYLKELLTQCKGKIEQSALQAGMTSRQLRNLMKKYSLKKEDFRCER
ncbi:sigma-54-dependent transcriptional regulator [Halodesulfovibrio aestuarii]|uniref:sigma-54 interaction domain-containing protein n=1 Tax=Halodesulfovibrio aestuarii TaxID=126333 RepID=UPI00040BD39F